MLKKFKHQILINECIWEGVAFMFKRIKIRSYARYCIWWETRLEEASHYTSYFLLRLDMRDSIRMYTFSETKTHTIPACSWSNYWFKIICSTSLTNGKTYLFHIHYDMIHSSDDWDGPQMSETCILLWKTS